MVKRQEGKQSKAGGRAIATVYETHIHSTTLDTARDTSSQSKDLISHHLNRITARSRETDEQQSVRSGEEYQREELRLFTLRHSEISSRIVKKDGQVSHLNV